MKMINLKNDILVCSALLKRDVDYYLRDKKSFIIFIIVYLSGLLVFLVALKSMIGNSQEYFIFLLVGYLVVSYMNISGSAGFEVIREVNEGKFEYDKTLPIPIYSFMRIAGISLRGLTNFLICFLLIMPYLIDFFTLPTLIIFIILSAILSIMFTGFSIIPLNFSHNMTFQSIVGSFIRTWFLLGSTIYYPYQLVPDFLKPLILLNPVTWVLEVIRNILNIQYAMQVDTNVSVLVIGVYLLIACYGSIKVLSKTNQRLF